VQGNGQRGGPNQFLCCTDKRWQSSCTGENSQSSCALVFRTLQIGSRRVRRRDPVPPQKQIVISFTSLSGVVVANRSAFSPPKADPFDIFDGVSTWIRPVLSSLFPPLFFHQHQSLCVTGKGTLFGKMPHSAVEIRRIP